MISVLQALTKEQLQAMTKADLIVAIIDERTTTEVTEQQGDARGMTRQVTKTFDYQHNLLSKRIVTTTYYPDGSVDVIRIRELDALGNVTYRLKIKHDGVRAVSVTPDELE